MRPQKHKYRTQASLMEPGTLQAAPLMSCRKWTTNSWTHATYPSDLVNLTGWVM